MPSRYTLIQYRPDPASDEQLNIGVIAWDADGAHVVFVESWEHVRLFGGQCLAARVDADREQASQSNDHKLDLPSHVPPGSPESSLETH